MSTTFTSGQRVRINEATPGNPDPKGVVYYDFMRNLSGEVIKAYPDGNVAISINRKSLPENIRKRHEISEQTSRDRWLNGLSEEDRNKLSEKDKKFSLRYTILVSAKHVVPESEATKTTRTASAKKAAPPIAEAAESHRLTSQELAAQEAAYLESIKKKTA
jgi:hypothetical protein